MPRRRVSRRAGELHVSGKGQRRTGSVARRLLAILEAFGEKRPELTIHEIGHHTGIPTSTLYRLLADLVDLGTVERLPDGRYALGLRLWEIVRLGSRTDRLVDVASPALRELHDLTRGDVTLAVLAGGDVLHVLSVRTLHPIEPTTRTGTRTPITATSIGSVLLAYAPSAVFDMIIGDEGNDLQQVLADVRRAGVAASRTQSGSTVIAAPVCGPSGAAAAAVALIVRDGNEARLTPLVRATGKRISREIAAFITQ